MKSKNELAKVSSRQPAKTPNDLRDALQLVADMTGDAKRAAEENSLTSAGKPKSELRGATKITNRLRDEQNRRKEQPANRQMGIERV